MLAFVSFSDWMSWNGSLPCQPFQCFRVHAYKLRTGYRIDKSFREIARIC
jgi:hypothetical protein